MAAIPNLSIGARYDLARDHALLAAAAAEPRSGLSAADARDEADRAMAARRQAVAAGYRDLDELWKGRDLVLLRLRADFKLLIMDVAMPADPFTAACRSPGRGLGWRSSGRARAACSASAFVAEAIDHNLLIIPRNVHSGGDTHLRISHAVKDATLRRGSDLLRNPPGALHQHLLD
jgi:hypothetical protein